MFRFTIYRSAADLHYPCKGSIHCRRRSRRRAKNSFKMPAHSSSKTPLVTWGLWLYGIENKSTREPQEPAFGSDAPYTILGSLALITAPAHMGQGSSVTYNVHCQSRHPPQSLAGSADRLQLGVGQSVFAYFPAVSSPRKLYFHCKLLRLQQGLPLLLRLPGPRERASRIKFSSAV